MEWVAPYERGTLVPFSLSFPFSFSLSVQLCLSNWEEGRRVTVPEVSRRRIANCVDNAATAQVVVLCIAIVGELCFLAVAATWQ